jgi:hypothetical protein
LSIVHTLLGARPPARTDDIAWEQVRIEQCATEDGSYATADTQFLDPVDTDPKHPGSRDFTFTSALVEGFFRLVFIDGDTNESVPTDPVFDDGSSPGALYATAGELRNALNLTSDVLSNAEANSILASACDLIDERLGARCIDPDSGRKVIPADEDDWRIAKLRDATVEVATNLFRDPTVASRQRARFTSGDVSVSGPYGPAFGERAEALLVASGLRVNTARMSVGHPRRRYARPLH